MTDDSVLAPGTVLDTRYEVTDFLGKGGFGATYKAIDRSRFDKVCVVKALVPPPGQYEIAQQLFEREAKALLELDHPRIPKLLAYFREQGRYFLVQDFAAGETLMHRLKRGVLDEPKVRDVVLQVTEILDYLQRFTPPIIHRDIKPDNLILRPDGAVMLIDFGAMREALVGSSSVRQTMIGTAGYAPPEQMNGHPTPASDIYALGASALELMTNQLPEAWEHPDTGRVELVGKVDCSPEFARVLERMLARQSARFQTPQAVRSALVEGETKVAPPVVESPPPIAPTARKPSAVRDTTVDPPRPTPPITRPPLPPTGPIIIDPPPPPPQRKALKWVGGIVGAAVLVALVLPSKEPAKSPVVPGVDSSGRGSNGGGSGRASDAGARRGNQPAVPDRNAAKTPDPGKSIAGGGTGTSGGRVFPEKQAANAARGSAPPQGAGAKAPAASSQDAGATAPAPTPTRTVADPCINVARCASAGPIMATVSYVIASQARSSGGIGQNVKVTLKIKNLTDKKIYLAYRAESQQLTDENGNKYKNDWNNTQFVRGIGLSYRNGSADPQFDLDPGESRDATLENYFYADGTTFLGTTYNYELTLDELVVSGTQARLGRSHALSYHGLKVSSGGGDDLSQDSGEEVPVGGPHVADAVAALPAQQPACDDTTRCYDAGRFTATVTHLWGSREKTSSGMIRNVFVTIRIQNKTDAPLALAYKSQSEALIDDEGNKYANDWNARQYIRGIGTRYQDQIDPQFVVAPGEWREATFENRASFDNKTIAGFTYNFDLTLDQLDLLPGNQARAGRSNAISFHNLKETPPAPDPVPSAGPCSSTPRCYPAGPFTAMVTRVWTTHEASSSPRQGVMVTVRIKNTSTTPLGFVYWNESGRIIDDVGNFYANDWNARETVRGMGMVINSEPDPHFQLAPGEARDVTFEHGVRIDPRAGNFGNTFAYTLTIATLELLPARQVRIQRQYAIGFHGLKEDARTAAVAPAAGPCAGAVSCYDAGSFTATVAELAIFETPQSSDLLRDARLTLKLKNVSNHPVTLSYRPWSQQLVDDGGKQYRNERTGGRQWVQNIPISGDGRPEAEFTLAPGETRDATFYENVFFGPRERAGNIFDYEMVLDEFEVLPGTQFRWLKSHSVTFHGVKDLRSMRQKLMDALIKKP